jgi:hypothetical protein
VRGVLPPRAPGRRGIDPVEQLAAVRRLVEERESQLEQICET